MSDASVQNTGLPRLKQILRATARGIYRTTLRAACYTIAWRWLVLAVTVCGLAAVGLRLVPTVRDLRFAWMEMPQQMLDEQAQKVLESTRAALMDWAEKSGEAPRDRALLGRDGRSGRRCPQQRRQKTTPRGGRTSGSCASTPEPGNTAGRRFAERSLSKAPFWPWTSA